MAEVVDAIIAELIVKGVDQYEAAFDRASGAHGRFKKTVDELKGQTFDLQKEAQRYKTGGDEIARSEEQTAQRVTRARKAQGDAAKTQASEEAKAAKDAAAVVKAAAKEKADAEKAAAREIAAAQRAAQRDQNRYYAQGPRIFEAKASVYSSADRLKDAETAREASAIEKQAARDQAEAARVEATALREAASAERAYYAQGPRIFEAKAKQFARQDAAATKQTPSFESGVAPDAVERGLAARSAATRSGTGANLGTVDPGSRAAASAQTDVMRQTRVEAEKTVVAEKEVNAAAVEQTRLQAGLLAARGKDRQLIREQIADMRTYNQLVRSGLDEQAAAVELDRIRAVRARENAVQEAARSRASAGQFAAGAGLGRFGGLNAATAGIAVAGAAAAGVAAVSSSIDFAKEIKNTADAVGLTTRQVQVYEAAARQAGVSTDQFRSGIGQLNSYLGRAKEGDEQAAKTFKVLGVNIKDAGSAGDILPTLIARISSIPDAAQRAAVETRLFGEEGRRLDALLSGGNERIGELAAGLERTGAILSSSDIAKLNDTENKLAAVKAQLQVDLAQVVAGNADAILKLADAFAQVANFAGKAVAAYEAFQNSGVGQVAAYLNPLTAPQRLGALAGRAVGYVTGGGPSVNADPTQGIGNLGSAEDFLKAQRGKVGNLASLYAPKPPKGKSADQLANEAEQRTKRYQDQLAGYQEQQLRAEADATGNINERAAIESELAERARNRQIADINSQEKIDLRKAPKEEAGLVRARAQTLRDAVTQATAQSEVAREQDVAASLVKQQNDIAQNRLSIERELLEGTSALARTSSERLAIQLRLIEIDKEAERRNLQAQIDEAKPGTDLTATRASLASLDSRYDERSAAARQQNLGPFASYVNTLPRTASEVREQFEQAAVSGIESLNSSLDRSIAKMLHLHGVAGQFLQDIINIGLHAAEAQIFGGAAGGGGGGIFGTILGAVGGLFGGGASSASLGLSGAASSLSLAGGAPDLSSALTLPGFATGGSGTFGGNAGVDKNVLALNGRPFLRVGQGETFTVTPRDIGSANGRVSSRPNVTNVMQSFTLDARGGITTPELLQHVNDVAGQKAAQAGRASYQASVDAAPGRVQRKQVLGS